MARGLTLLVAALVVYVTQSVQGTSHLSFSNASVDITRSGCGVDKLCVETPDDCTPGTDSCLFVSVVAAAPVAPNGAMLSIELSGESTDIIALGLTANASEGTTMFFICGNDKGFVFSTITLNNTNSAPTGNEEPVSDIRGTVNGTQIDCEFNITSVNTTRSRSSEATTSSILLGTGFLGGMGVPFFFTLLNNGPLNLADPASNLIRNTTAAPSVNATAAPSVNATAAPSVNATAAPSGNATAAPSGNATAAPSGNATAAPSGNATAAPSGNATAAPSGNATAAPSGNATAAPSGNATAAPSVNATAAPSVNATAAPSVNATAAPSVNATAAPSANATAAPSNTPMPNSGGAVQPLAVLLLLSVLSLAVMLREGGCG